MVLARLLIFQRENGIFEYRNKKNKDKNLIMKKFKILFSAFAILLGTSAFSQAEAPKDDSSVKTTEEAKPTMKDASSAAKAFTTDMCKALNITDKSLMQTISSINENYEVTLMKSTDKADMTDEQKAALAQKFETNRLRRFQGILSPSEIKTYQTWKAKRDAEATEK